VLGRFEPGEMATGMLDTELRLFGLEVPAICRFEERPRSVESVNGGYQLSWQYRAMASWAVHGLQLSGGRIETLLSVQMLLLALLGR
jgi:DUF1365 family protein